MRRAVEEAMGHYIICYCILYLFKFVAASRSKHKKMKNAK